MALKLKVTLVRSGINRRPRPLPGDSRRRAT